MSVPCANCGRSDLMQPDLRNYQCLACGALTAIADGSLVPNNIVNTVTSPSGHPVVELSTTTPSFAGDESGARTPNIGCALVIRSPIHHRRQPCPILQPLLSQNRHQRHL